MNKLHIKTMQFAHAGKGKKRTADSNINGDTITQTKEIHSIFFFVMSFFTPFLSSKSHPLPPCFHMLPLKIYATQPQILPKNNFEAQFALLSNEFSIFRLIGNNEK